MILREKYMEKLKNFKDKDLIKVITGIRRCGKSTLLLEYANYLRLNNVDDMHIIEINFENPKYNFNSYLELYDYINSFIKDQKKYYVFLDEIQNVSEFEKAVDGLYLNKNVDIYITGSNAFLLSSELATLLSGRYIEIKMMPLSFKEYISSVGEEKIREKYFMYLKNSSFPYTLSLNKPEEINDYLDGLYNSIIVKDISLRKPLIDMGNMKNFIEFLFDNIGNLFSSTSISNKLNSVGKKISVPTIENYLELLANSFIVYKAVRYDVKGKEYLSVGCKYYVCDIALRYYLLGDKNADRGFILENVIYLELVRRGYKVYVGKFDNLEINFVAVKNGVEEYYQISYTVEDKDVLKRELNPLNKINDNYEKFLITMDENSLILHDGIKQIYALDWLLDK